MSTEIAKANGAMAPAGTMDQAAVLRTLGLDPRDAKAQALVVVCDRYGLDPLLKHAVLIQGTLYVTRDGLMHVAHDSGKFDGLEVETVAETQTHFVAVATVYRKDMGRPFRFQGRYPKGGRMAKEYGPEMAEKVAVCRALRHAFDVSLCSREELWDQDTAAAIAEMPQQPATRTAAAAPQARSEAPRIATAAPQAATSQEEREEAPGANGADDGQCIVCGRQVQAARAALCRHKDVPITHPDCAHKATSDTGRGPAISALPSRQAAPPAPAVYKNAHPEPDAYDPLLDDTPPGDVAAPDGAMFADDPFAEDQGDIRISPNNAMARGA